MKILHFRPYVDVFGVTMYETADEETVREYAAYIGDTSPYALGYIIHRRALAELEKSGRTILIVNN